MLLGILLGIVCCFVKKEFVEKCVLGFDKAIGHLLKLLIYLIPIFLVGFMMKLIHEKTLESIIKDYAVVFAVIACAQFSYIALLYFMAGRFQFKECISSMKNMLPAAIAGFGSMSSAAAMPLTILGVEKNSKQTAFSQLVVPATVNVHLIGDCFAIPIFAFAVMKTFGMPTPFFGEFVLFAMYFVLAKFSVAAVPGGGIIVMLPLLESHFGFQAEMASLITALYILFDPVITCANVCGNGGFAQMLSKFKPMLDKKVSN